MPQAAVLTSTSMPHVREIVSRILSDEQIDSLRPAINIIFYADKSKNILGLHRFNKLSLITSRIRAIARECAYHSKFHPVIKNTTFSEPGRIFLLEFLSHIDLSLNIPELQIQPVQECSINLLSSSDAIIFADLGQNRSGRTTIVISHRAWTLKNMDRIYVINEGHLVEQGTYDNLIAAKGRFYDLFQNQSS